MGLTEKQVVARIRSHGRGHVFTARQLSSLTEDSGSVRTALTRLVQKKTIRRLAHGLYDLPVVHPKLGPIMPSADQVIEAIKKSEAIEVQPTGAYAANLLGLSTQVPLRLELYTNGPRKKIRFGRQEILLKPTTPKNMVGAGTKAGLILHALKHLGRENITNITIETIRSRVEQGDVKHIQRQATFAPVWIAAIMREIIEDL